MSFGSPASYAARSVRAPALLLLAAATLALAALPILASPSGLQDSAECPQSPVRFEANQLIWEADPGLERLARRLADDRRAMAPMPAIGDLGPAVRGTTVRFAADLMAR